MIDLRFFQATATVIPVLFIALAFQVRAFNPQGPEMLTELRKLKSDIEEGIESGEFQRAVEAGSLSPEHLQRYDSFLRSRLASERIMSAVSVVEAAEALFVAVALMVGEGVSMYALATGRGSQLEGIVVGWALGIGAGGLFLRVIWPTVEALISGLRGR